MSNPIVNIKEAPPCRPGYLRVQAMMNGFFGSTDIEPNEVFDIPIEPLNPVTGLPLAFSDSRKKVGFGRNGWMKAFGESEDKKLADLEAVKAKRDAEAHEAELKRLAAVKAKKRKDAEESADGETEEPSELPAAPAPEGKKLKRSAGNLSKLPAAPAPEGKKLKRSAGNLSKLPAAPAK